MFGKAVDPVCGMEVDERKAIRREIRGVMYYFCSDDCANRFEGQLGRHEGSVSHRGHKMRSHSRCC